MKFHSTHGRAITLLDNRMHAVRDGATFGNGIVFGDQPLLVGQKVCLKMGCVFTWSGALRIGVTTHNPARLAVEQLPKYVYPDLTSKEGFWARAVPEKMVSSGCRVMVYLTSSGHMQIFINGQHMGVLLTDLPTNQTLWLLMDIYGNTTSLMFVEPENAPREILARGLEAVQAYDQSCGSGVQPVFRTRLMLVGKDRVGKTSLKRAITGQQHNSAEQSTDGIDLSASCSFSLSNRSSWKLAIRGDNVLNEESQPERHDLGIIGGPGGLEEEYNYAIASNIVQELLLQSRQQETAGSDTKISGLHSSASILNTGLCPLHSSVPSSSLSTPKTNKTLDKRLEECMPEFSPQVPERVVTLVHEMLNTFLSRKESGVTEDSRKQPLQKDKTVVLNIWDFAGQAAYYTTHQVFLTSRAVYVIVFNLCDDFIFPSEDDDQNENELSTLEYMDFWMRSIHAHAAENTSDDVDNTTLSPPIFVVGTHRNSLHENPEVQAEMVDEKFSELREFLADKPYTRHLVTPFYAVENSLPYGEDLQIMQLKEDIERVAGQQPYMGEQMPIRWLRFEQELTEKADSGTNYASLNQVREMARNHGVNTDEEFHTMLAFYHDLGLLIHYAATDDSTAMPDDVLANTVVLCPQWLAQAFKHIVLDRRPNDLWDLQAECWERLERSGILDKTLLPSLLPGSAAEHAVLLRLMEKLDLLCPTAATQDSQEENSNYIIPMRLSICHNTRSMYMQTMEDAVLYLDFNGFLPDGLFFRILNRTFRWSQTLGGRDQCLSRDVARFYLDSNHDLVLHMSQRHLHRVKVVIMFVGQQEATSPRRTGRPQPAACALVRNFLESTLADLRHLWMKRIAYQVCVVCPCKRVCELHKTEGCNEENCLHFLHLDECLASKVVCCEHRRVKTDGVRSWFPEPQNLGFQAPIVPVVQLEESYGNIEKQIQGLPLWMKSAAKLLNSGDENQDWMALARLLEYKASRIERLTEDANPALAFLMDWVVSNGNTTMAVDLLTSCLQQLGRDDVIMLIQRARENEGPAPQVFLSYQWEAQDQVRSIRDHLERLGYSCWMDVGQMGGGDHLRAKIEEGLRNCKVVVACLSARYVASQLCSRELCLADLLQKPIVPVMLHPLPWPPPGAVALCLAHLVYINMQGVGGHGGSGIHADLQDKYAEIVQRVAMYATPTLTPYVRLSKLTSGIQRQLSQSSDTSETGSEEPVTYRYPSEGSFSERIPQYMHDPSEPSMDVLLSRISESEVAAPMRQVPTANVTKCTVCTVL
ncbi:uncharacterized protein LOC112573680 isoform X2 [Pomacea canaliculata]|uniref:uncharacterized protein LOC112573680 isoform X2 n=1 Tax=Pomacea canaliculata TaxID=400727 RepID=UPI000D72E653|nr:uncharacterized protein LOC112573680 isoform X2 [Pomacea canaliculata]